METLGYVFGGRLMACVGVHWIFFDHDLGPPLFLKHVAILTQYSGNQQKNRREKTGKAFVCGTVTGWTCLDEWPSCILLCAGWVYLFMVVYVDFTPPMGSCLVGARSTLAKLAKIPDDYY